MAPVVCPDYYCWSSNLESFLCVFAPFPFDSAIILLSSLFLRSSAAKQPRMQLCGSFSKPRALQHVSRCSQKSLRHQQTSSLTQPRAAAKREAGAAVTGSIAASDLPEASWSLPAAAFAAVSLQEGALKAYCHRPHAPQPPRPVLSCREPAACWCQLLQLLLLCPRHRQHQQQQPPTTSYITTSSSSTAQRRCKPTALRQLPRCWPARHTRQTPSSNGCRSSARLSKSCSSWRSGSGPATTGSPPSPPSLLSMSWACRQCSRCCRPAETVSGKFACTPAPPALTPFAGCVCFRAGPTAVCPGGHRHGMTSGHNHAVLLTHAVCPAGSTPVTVMVVRMGLRVDNKTNKLQERLRFLRDMMGVEHAAFFTFEGREAMLKKTACS